MGETIVIGGDVNLLENVIDGQVQIDILTDGTSGIFTPVYPATYHGETTITPTTEEQIIPVGGLMVAEDITVNPSPQNYGLITWNGNTLTVS